MPLLSWFKRLFVKSKPRKEFPKPTPPPATTLRRSGLNTYQPPSQRSESKRRVEDSDSTSRNYEHGIHDGWSGYISSRDDDDDTWRRNHSSHDDSSSSFSFGGGDFGGGGAGDSYDSGSSDSGSSDCGGGGDD